MDINHDLGLTLRARFADLLDVPRDTDLGQAFFGCLAFNYCLWQPDAPPILKPGPYNPHIENAELTRMDRMPEVEVEYPEDPLRDNAFCQTRYREPMITVYGGKTPEDKRYTFQGTASMIRYILHKLDLQ